MRGAATLGLRLFAGLLLAIAMALPAAHAAGVSRADTQKIRAVIQGQLAAFAADDAKRAFSYAAPGIRQMFGTPEHFLAMVREGYPVVYRPASVGFLAPVAAAGSVIQAVEMADADGALWLAVYQMQRQRDGRWRIAGCDLQRSEGRVV